jgi:hypothetical protein
MVLERKQKLIFTRQSKLHNFAVGQKVVGQRSRSLPVTWVIKNSNLEISRPVFLNSEIAIL